MSDATRDAGSTEEVESGWTEALQNELKELIQAEKPGGAPESPPVETEATTEVKQAEPVQESQDALEPLASWSDEVKSKFSSLDRPSQQFLLDREKDIERHLTKRTQELSDAQKKYQRIEDVLKPYEEVARTQGVDLTPHLAQALQYYTAFNRDPVSTLKALMQASNLTAEQLLGKADEDPTIRTLRSEIESTRREVANLKQGSSQKDTATLVAQVNEFRDAKDEQGNPKHPHFERVRTLMAPLVDSGKSLQEAYSEAVWAVPEYRQEQEKLSREKAEKEARDKAEKERATKVKKAKDATTLPASDADKGTKQKEFGGDWAAALREELSHMQ